VNGGANKINSITFTLSDSRKESLGKDALKKAIENARSKAELVAQEVDVNLKQPIYISAEYTNVVPYYAAYKEISSTEISGGSVKVTASVSVSYGFE
jgi:uncharacterized protein YggE